MPYKDATKQRLFQANWVKERRNAWIVVNGPCQKCGLSENLEVDHIDPKLKTMNPTRLWSLSEEKRNFELQNCQVLCSKCHKEKTALAKLRPHGFYSRYKRGCRCEECKAANAKQKRDRELRKKGEKC